MRTLGDVQSVSIENPLHECLCARRTVDIERPLSALNPLRENHVSETQCVVRVEMREEDSIELRRILPVGQLTESLDSISSGSGCATNDAYACIEQVRDGVDYDCHA
jgi:hypothetical protein